MAQIADRSMMESLNTQMGGTNGDERLRVRFSIRPLENPDKSVEAGRPIFEDREFIEIMIPGNRDHVINRVVRDEDKVRFAKQYQHFKAGVSDESLSGTPLSAWPGITRAQAEELAYFHVRTVEQLANMDDANAQKFMGINALKTKAKLFLEAAAGNAPAVKLQAELDARDAKIAALEDAIREIQSRQGKKG